MAKNKIGLAGMQYEGSPADEAQDMRQAKKAGMSKNAFEKSPADRKADLAGMKKGKKPFGRK